VGKIIDTVITAFEKKYGIVGVPAKDDEWKKLIAGLPSAALEMAPPLALFAVPSVLNEWKEAGVAQIMKQFGAYTARPTLLPINIAIEAVRRGIVEGKSKDAVISNIKSMGFSDDKIEVMYKVAEFFPSPRDLIQWAGKQVFETDLVEELRLTDEFAQINIEQWAKSGVTKEQALNFWIAHWQQCSFAQIVEMLHRNVFGDDTVGRHVLELWYRANEIPTYWREAVSKIIWEIPNRIDARRFWELRVVDAPRLQRIYENLGYRGVDLENEVLFSKIAVDLPKLFKRFGNGWITLDEVRNALRALGANEETINEHIQEYTDNSPLSLNFTGLWSRYENGWITLDEVRQILAGQGMQSVQIEELLQTKLIKTAPLRERDLTKAELIKAWHNKVLDESELRALLIRMGYDDNEVSVIIAINQPKDAKPPTKSKLELLVERIRLIEGFDYKIITEDIIEQDDKIVALEAHLVEMITAQADVALIETLRIDIESEKLRLKELRQLHSA